MAASRADVPIILLAGRTPATQKGHPASRSSYIHWGQDVYDQTAPLREWVKWEYEIKRPEDMASVVDRAVSMAMAEPEGPVCLTFAREVLYDPPARMNPSPPAPLGLPTRAPDPEQIAQAAEWLAKAENPLIITSSAGRKPAAVRKLAALGETCGAGVVSFNSEYHNLSRKHPCFQGFQTGQLLSQADLVLIVECPAPWYPNTVQPNARARVIHIGVDPMYGRIPLRHFPSDLSVQADPGRALQALASAVEIHPGRSKAAVEKRMRRLVAGNIRLNADWTAAAERGAADEPLSPMWISWCIGRMTDPDWVLFNEYDNAMPFFAPDRAGHYFCVPQAGFLGWSHGASLGYKLGRPESKVIVTVGDGSYLFGAPGTCHLFSQTHNLPILTVIYNNSGYNAVRRATKGLYPGGDAVLSGSIPLTHLGDTSQLHVLAQAFGGYGEGVHRPRDLAPALKRAMNQVEHHGRQAVLNVFTADT
jgi:acetolactate synthase-1/2/3 large subunit